MISDVTGGNAETREAVKNPQCSLGAGFWFFIIYMPIITWRIPWTEEPGGLQYMGLQRI